MHPVGTVLSYIFYWLSVVAALVYMKWEEGRISLFGRRSRAWHRRQAQQNAILHSRLAEQQKGEAGKDERHSPSSSISSERLDKAKGQNGVQSSDRKVVGQDGITVGDTSSMLPQVGGTYPSVTRPGLHSEMTEVSFK